MSTGPESISLPLAHRVARRLAAGGLVGASWYWRVARLLATVPPAGVVVLSDGTPIVHDPTDWTCRMSYEGTYEREILRLLPELLSDGDAMVDVGANVGILGARAARLVGESGRVVAVEPSPRCLEDLRRVVDGMSNVTIVEAALGPERGTVRLTGWDNPDHRGLGTAVDGHRSGIEENWYEGTAVVVPQLRLADVLDEHLPGREVALLKVDVEGYEPAVLAGAPALFDEGRVRAAILEVTPDVDAGWAGDLIAAADRYDAFAIGERGRVVRRTDLLRVAPAEAVSRSAQWNLLLRRR
ncbi:uncharacterized protein METZ01_LOCUS73853 [marine metagenome]|uniref:Methyltransferase FkbM domain-containing protein n=1 Tax=marine metagenome TaxID=408172 RepID=A0A381TYS6_9ZZZZ